MKIELRSGSLNQIRKENKVPGNIYGKSIESISVQSTQKEIAKALHDYGRNMTFSIKLEGKTHKVYFKDVQLDPLNYNNYIHFSLHKITGKYMMTSEIGLDVIGREEVEKRGLFVQMVVHAIEVEYEAGTRVGHFEVNVTDLDVNDSVYIKDLKVPEGVKILDDPEKLLINIKEPSVEVEETKVLEGEDEAVEGDEAQEK